MVRLRVYGFFSACTGIRTHGTQAENQLRHKQAWRKGNFWGSGSVLGRRAFPGQKSKLKVQSSRKAPIGKRQGLPLRAETFVHGH
jgi:hypothetical protein